MNQITVPPVSQTIRYDEMCRSIAAAYEMDEVKHIRDKALAIEVYSKQAMNTEAERQACEIRLRAERKVGQLLKDREKAKGARGNPGGQGAPIVRSPDETTQTLNDLRISKAQSANWQKLADIPEDKFEEALTKPAAKPSTTGIIAAHAEPKKDKVDPRALWVWGRLLDFERQGLLDLDPNDLLASMLDHMSATTRELAPRVAAWLQRIGQ